MGSMFQECSLNSQHDDKIWHVTYLIKKKLIIKLLAPFFVCLVTFSKTHKMDFGAFTILFVYWLKPARV